MRFPPLNAVRAFEVAARHQNFSDAAKELNVTQGAVSRHVKTLEDFLNVRLFERKPQGVELTAAGQSLLPELSVGLDQIVRATHLVSVGNREIKLIAPLTLSTRWLIPLLENFHALHPHFRVSASTFGQHYDKFFEGGFDIAVDVALDAPRPANLDARLLRREEITPVCSPALLEKKKLDHYADLAQHNLLHPTPCHWDWKTWCNCAGLDPVIAERGDVFDFSTEATISAALAGMGVAAIDLLLIEQELQSGALIAPFDVVATENTGYFVVTHNGRFKEEKIHTFSTWLLEEMNKTLIAT